MELAKREQLSSCLPMRTRRQVKESAAFLKTKRVDMRLRRHVPYYHSSAVKQQAAFPVVVRALTGPRSPA
ncbi:hypothetical protein BDZ89DRAFT_1079788, partial [Hymenopellis radicata]